MKKFVIALLLCSPIIAFAQQQQVDASLTNDTLGARVPGMVFEKVNKRKINANPKVVGVKSAGELRTMTNVTAVDTQFVIQLTNYGHKFTFVECRMMKRSG